MKRKFTFILIAIFLFSYGHTFSQDWTDYVTGKKGKLVMQDNEFERNNAGQDASIYCNPLMLNGIPLDYGSFSLKSKGELSLIKGEPKASSLDLIPFTINLRRGSKIISNNEMTFLNQELLEIEISKVLSYAQVGDQLIINPIRKEDWMAKRILKLTL